MQSVNPNPIDITHDAIDKKRAIWKVALRAVWIGSFGSQVCQLSIPSSSFSAVHLCLFSAWV